MSKFRDSIRACTEVKELSGGKILVALSGGKDSVVTLDLCLKAGFEVETYFMYIIRGLECIEAPVELAAKRYGVKVHYVPHPSASKIFQQHRLQHPSFVSERTPTITFPKIEAHVRRITGIDWLAYGWRKADNITRRVVLNRWGTYSQEYRKLFPISEWLTKDVVGYLRSLDYPLPKQVGGEKGVSGFSLSRESIVWLHDNYPKDYQTVLKAFPLAEVLVEHAKMYPDAMQRPRILPGLKFKEKQNDADQAPEVHDGEDEPG